MDRDRGSDIFRLFLPDLFATPFSSSDNLVELPDRGLRRMHILIRDAQRRNINPGRYKIFVNGKGIGNVFEERTTTDGTLLVMEPETLRKRPDEIFDPRENAIEITAEDRRGRRYYQNWILRVNDTKRNALFAYSSSISPDDPGGIPPDVNIEAPASPPVLGAASAAGKVTLRGNISPGAALRVDGRHISIPTKSSGINLFEYSAPVTAGQRELVLEASDSKGNSRKVVIPIYRTEAAPNPVRFAGQKFAVVIGVSRFGDVKAAPPPLPLAAADAREFANRLEKNAGFRRENIRVLTDEKATLEMVRIALSDFAAKAQRNDVLLIYLATHGLHDPRPNRGDRLYLALHGTQMGTLDNTALSFSDLELILNRSVRTRQCFLIFDVGHPLNDEWRFRDGRNLVNNHVLNLFGDKPDWGVLVSASSDQVGLDRRGAASSLFAHWVAEGLGGAADLNRDRVVTGKELFSFVTEKVKTDSQGAQQPRFRMASQAGDSPIAGGN